MTTTTTIIELDERRRTSLGKIGNKEHTRYRVEEHPDGTIVLTPAIVLSAREAELLANPELVAKLREAIAEAHDGRTVKLTDELLAALEGDDDTPRVARPAPTVRRKAVATQIAERVRERSSTR